MPPVPWHDDSPIGTICLKHDSSLSAHSNHPLWEFPFYEDKQWKKLNNKTWMMQFEDSFQETCGIKRASTTTKPSSLQCINVYHHSRNVSLSRSVCCMLNADAAKKPNHYEWGEKNSLCLEALWCVPTHMAGSQQQLTASLGHIDSQINTHAHRQRHKETNTLSNVAK